MKTMDTLDEFLLGEMRDMYHAEGQLLRAVPRLARHAASPKLRHALERHWKETQKHRDRLEQTFAILGEPVRGTRCEAMAGLLLEGDELLEAAGDPSVKDAALIFLMQKIEHHEITSYRCLCTCADLLGFNEVGYILGKSLEEEKDADQTLAELALNEIHISALAE